MTIFISYRRNDSADVTGRIYDRLVYGFGKETIFKDVDSIPIGVNFRSYLSDIIEKSTVLLVVIGPHWLGITNEVGERRLEDPSDFVRIEIEAALKRNIVIVPLLVGGASMPKAAQLPSSLEELAFYNGIPIRTDPDFHKDMNRLMHELGSTIKPQTSRTYYPSSDFPANQTFGDILTRPPVETISIAQAKVIDFMHFLQTPWGRLLAGTAIGGIVLYLLEGIVTRIYFDNSTTVVNGLGFALPIGGVSGLILYPHRKTVLYIVIGIVLGPIVSALIFNFVGEIPFSEFGRYEFLNAAFFGVYIGTMLGAIVSRIQHRRKKM